jgi:ketosteroid isomerase-like protein
MKKSSDLDLINQLQRKFEESILEGDIDKYVDVIDDEAVAMEPNLHMLKGKKAIRAWFEDNV